MRACHKLVAKTAKEICAAVYEELARDNAFYNAWPNQRAFVRVHWAQFIEHARSTMTDMLTGNYPESMKDEIMDALTKDWSLRGLNAQASSAKPTLLH